MFIVSNTRLLIKTMISNKVKSNKDKRILKEGPIFAHVTMDPEV